MKILSITWDRLAPTFLNNQTWRLPDDEEEEDDEGEEAQQENTEKDEAIRAVVE